MRFPSSFLDQGLIFDVFRCVADGSSGVWGIAIRRGLGVPFDSSTHEDAENKEDRTQAQNQ